MRTLTLGLVALSGLWAGAASADPTFGSVSLATQRNCTGATERCDGTLPGQAIAIRSISGGQHVFANTDLTLANGSFARGWADYGTLDLPEIYGETYAAGNERMNINTFAFQSYVFTGSAATPFSLSGTLHIVDASASPADVVDGGVTYPGGAYAGGSIYSQYLAIWDINILGAYTTADELFNNLFYATCDTPGVLGYAFGSGSLAGGEQSFDVTTTSCDPAGLFLAPGQEVLAVAGMQLPVNRGGFADSTHSFITRLGDDLSADDKAVLTSSLVSALALVPEPATWAMMIGGFALAGVALRSKRTGVVFG